MIVTDRLTLGEPKYTREGYMAVRAKSARTGVYDYLGIEVDPTGTKFAATDTVKVYRAPDEVFDARAVHSFLMKPITDNHPSEAVTAGNWASKARGVVAGAIRDGDYLAFDLILMDKSLIDQVKSGKRELSNGYMADVAFVDGVAPDGTAYQAVQKSIIGNHVAVVDKGRAGSECRIADAAFCAAAPDGLNLNFGDRKPMTKTIVFDGISIEVTDQAAQAIDKLQAQNAKLTADMATAAADHAKTLATADAAKAKAEAERDAAQGKIMDDAAIDARVAVRADLIATAKAIHDADYTGKTDAEIRKIVVTAKGIVVDGKPDAYVDARFDILAEDAKSDAGMRANISRVSTTAPAGTQQAIVDASFKAVDTMNAWRTQQ